MTKTKQKEVSFQKFISRVKHWSGLPLVKESLTIFRVQGKCLGSVRGFKNWLKKSFLSFIDTCPPFFSTICAEYNRAHDHVIRLSYDCCTHAYFYSWVGLTCCAVFTGVKHIWIDLLTAIFRSVMITYGNGNVNSFGSFSTNLLILILYLYLAYWDNNLIIN